jgi:nucleoside-diphosphate-sugar epimerase
MKTALIGYTGFVGSNIAARHVFDDLYNSSNIDEIEGREYDLVVSAANRAEMWRINQEGEKDLAEIKEYVGHISKVRVHKLVLISTVGVYKTAVGVDEDTPIEAEDLLPYGANRYFLEQYCHDNFDTTILRLPGLFGTGLKKNVIYDLLNNNNLDRIHKDGVYQYYNLANLWHDIEVAINNGLPLVNLATPPVSTEELAKYCFDKTFTNEPADVLPTRWDMHTKYASTFHGPEHYIMTKDEELDDIKQFIAKYATVFG